MTERGWRSNRRDNYGDNQGAYRRPYSQHDHFPPTSGPAGARRKGLKNKRFGLFGVTDKDRRKKQSIPLKSVHVQADIVDYLAQVEVTQQFVNLEENPIETTYTFPIAPNSAVCGFSAEIEGKKIVAEVKGTEEAKDAYDDAISSGHGAYLGQEDRSAVFTVTVGNLPPGKEATIRIRYVAELRLVGNKNKNKKNKGKDKKAQLLPFEDDEQRLKFILPSRLAPKAKKPQQQGAYGAVPAPTYNRFPEYTLTINVNLKTTNPFTGIASAQPIGLEFLSTKEAKIWLSPIIKALKYDFTLLVSLPEEQKTHSYAVVEEPETPEGDYAVVFVLFPKELLATAKPDETQEKEPEAPKATENKEAEKVKEDKEAAPSTEGEKPSDQGTKESSKPTHVNATELSWEWPSGVQAQQTLLPTTVHQTRGFLLSYASVPASAFLDGSVFPVTLTGKSTAGRVALTVDVNGKNAVKGDIVHKLFARSRIRDLERVLKDKVEEDKKAEVVALAKRYSLASHYTSFVAVEERTEATEGTMVSRVVPLNAFGYGEVQGRAPRGREDRQQVGERRDTARPAGGYPSRGQYDRQGGGRYRDERGYGGREERGYGGRDTRDRERGDRGERGGRSDWGGREDHHRTGGRDHYQQHQHQGRRPRTLEVSLDLADRLVAAQAKDGTYWSLTSTISEILGVQLTKLVDGLIGYPVSEYVSTIWATSLVLACLRANPDAAKKHSGLLAGAQKWLDEETERHGYDGTAVWVKKATEYLVSILN